MHSRPEATTISWLWARQLAAGASTQGALRHRAPPPRCRRPARRFRASCRVAACMASNSNGFLGTKLAARAAGRARGVHAWPATHRTPGGALPRAPSPLSAANSGRWMECYGVVISGVTASLSPSLPSRTNPTLLPAACELIPPSCLPHATRVHTTMGPGPRFKTAHPAGRARRPPAKGPHVPSSALCACPEATARAWSVGQVGVYLQASAGVKGVHR